MSVSGLRARTWPEWPRDAHFQYFWSGPEPGRNRPQEADVQHFWPPSLGAGPGSHAPLDIIIRSFPHPDVYDLLFVMGALNAGETGASVAEHPAPQRTVTIAVDSA